MSIKFWVSISFIVCLVLGTLLGFNNRPIIRAIGYFLIGGIMYLLAIYNCLTYHFAWGVLDLCLAICETMVFGMCLREYNNRHISEREKFLKDVMNIRFK